MHNYLPLQSATLHLRFHIPMCKLAGFFHPTATCSLFNAHTPDVSKTIYLYHYTTTA
jgi:hypothetical protein